MNNVFNKTMNETSTLSSWLSSVWGTFTVSEWCLLIGAVVTLCNFIKNYYIDMKKLRMSEEEHQIKLEKLGKTK